MNAAEALNRLAEQTGSVMLYSYDLARARQANAVHGRYSLLDGLELLLRDTGLSGGLSDKRVVIIAEGGIVPDGKGENVRKRGLIASLIAVLAGSNGIDAKADQESAPTKLEEVVVTAQKREERLQDVPMSIAVLGGDKLDSYTGESARDILRTVSGVTFSQNIIGDATTISIRGVAPNAGGTTVGYYMDGVPFGFVTNSIVPDTNIYDLERIEVLRGPQGTLYGASSLNGVVRILTHEPNLNQFQFKGRTSASTTEGGSETYRVDGALNVPIVEGKLAARAMVSYADMGGWIDNLVGEDINGAQNIDARVKFKAQPTDALTINLSYWGSRHDVESQNIGTRDDLYPGTLFPEGDIDFDSYGVEIAYAFPGFTVSSITSNMEYENLTQLDWSPFADFGLSDYLTSVFDADVLTEELLIKSSNDSEWRWSGGVFYRDAKDNLIQSNPAFGVFSDATSKSESYAVFGELTKVFADGAFELNGGLRYFDDRVESSDGLDPNFNPKSSFDEVSPRVVVTWHANKDTTLYTSYAQGFRSGFNQESLALSLIPDLPPVKPDTLNNYEVGAKGLLWANKLAYEAAVYFVDWKDTQQLLSVFYNNGLFSTNAGVNAESASGLGADFALTLQPVDGLDLTGSVSVNDITVDSPVRSGDVVLYKEGSRLNGSSKRTASASASYTHVLAGSGLTATYSLSGSYTSSFPERFLNPDGTLNFVTNESFSAMQASVEIRAAGRWSLQLFADNLTNERPLTQVDPNIPFYSRNTRPRTVGLQLEFRY